jgi:TusA-related sulfurtransferase
MKELSKSAGMDETYDHYLDITGYVCPMTFVRTKLLIERMRPGETALVRLRGDEPKRNVPRSVIEQGDEVVSLRPAAAPDSWDLVLRKRPAG